MRVALFIHCLVVLLAVPLAPPSAEKRLVVHQLAAHPTPASTVRLALIEGKNNTASYHSTPGRRQAAAASSWSGMNSEQVAALQSAVISVGSALGLAANGSETDDSSQDDAPVVLIAALTAVGGILVIMCVCCCWAQRTVPDEGEMWPGGVPPGCSVGEGGVLFFPNGEPVLGADGPMYITDKRVPPLGWIGPDGIILNAHGNPVLRDDGKPLIAGEATGPWGEQMPPGGSVGEGGVILDASGNAVVTPDGQMLLVYDKRVPPGGSIGPGGVILRATGNPVLGADGRPLVATAANVARANLALAMTLAEKVAPGAASDAADKANEAAAFMSSAGLVSHTALPGNMPPQYQPPDLRPPPADFDVDAFLPDAHASATDPSAACAGLSCASAAPDGIASSRSSLAASAAAAAAAFAIGAPTTFDDFNGSAAPAANGERRRVTKHRSGRAHGSNGRDASDAHALGIVAEEARMLRPRMLGTPAASPAWTTTGAYDFPYGMPNMGECGGCGEPLGASFVFCPECGTRRGTWNENAKKAVAGKVDWSCPGCSEELPAAFGHCIKCGTTRP